MYGIRTTCEDVKKIEINYLRKHGCLKPGYSGTLSWTRDGEPYGKIGFRTQGGCLDFNYKVKNYGETEWKPVSLKIEFDWTRQHLGGERQWFVCPKCFERCGVLYLMDLALCRKCQGLIYESQTEAPMFRMLSQTQKLRQKLGGSGNMDEPFPDKPKGMHWKTYWRIRTKAEAAEQRLWRAEAEWLGML